MGRWPRLYSHKTHFDSVIVALRTKTQWERRRCWCEEEARQVLACRSTVYLKACDVRSLLRLCIDDKMRERKKTHFMHSFKYAPTHYVHDLLSWSLKTQKDEPPLQAWGRWHREDGAINTTGQAMLWRHGSAIFRRRETYDEWMDQTEGLEEDSRDSERLMLFNVRESDAQIIKRIYGWWTEVEEGREGT